MSTPEQDKLYAELFTGKPTSAQRKKQAKYFADRIFRRALEWRDQHPGGYPPLTLSAPAEKPFRQIREGERIPRYMVAALLAGCEIVFDKMEYGTLDEMIERVHFSRKYALPAATQFDAELPNQALAETWAAAFAPAVEQMQDELQVGWQVHKDQALVQLDGPQTMYDSIVTNLLAGYDMVLVRNGELFAYLGDLDYIRDKIRGAKLEC